MIESDQQADQLRLFLEGRDIACPGCAYNVRDLKNDRCPECGEQLTLSLRLAEPRQRALITGLIALAAGAGLGGLLLIYGVIQVVFLHRYASGFDRFFVMNSIGFVIHGAAVYLWVKNWSRIRRARSDARGILVAVCCVMPLLFIVMFSTYVR